MAKIDKKNKAGLIPYIFVAFFATFITVDIVFFVIANHTWRGLQTEDGYQKGRNYNDTLEKVKQQKSLGWKLKAKLEQNGVANFANLKVCALDENKKPIINAKVLVKLSIPVQDGFDFQQNLIEENDCYKTKISFPKKGQWDFEFVVVKGPKAYQSVKRYIIR